jgi:hypothetical protein
MIHTSLMAIIIKTEKTRKKKHFSRVFAHVCVFFGFFKDVDLHGVMSEYILLLKATFFVVR